MPPAVLLSRAAIAPIDRLVAVPVASLSHVVRGLPRELHKPGRMATVDNFGTWIETATMSADFEPR
jgi:hypothetical protein